MISFLTFADYYGKKAGSSRIRADWLINHWTEAEHYISGKEYDVEIFQKVYWYDRLKNTGAIKILDICDPDWFDNPNVLKMAKGVDAITAPTQPFADFFKAYVKTPVFVIPDRVDLDIVKPLKKHEGKATKVVWFGFSHNQDGLQQVVDSLARYNLKLTVVSDNMRVYFNKLNDTRLFNFVKWDDKTADSDIVENGDFVILPPHQLNETGKIPYSKSFKSNNKTVHSWALGLPVATSLDELVRFIDPEERKKESEIRLKEVQDNYDVKQSVVEYKEIIKELS